MLLRFSESWTLRHSLKFVDGSYPRHENFFGFPLSTEINIYVDTYTVLCYFESFKIWLLVQEFKIQG